EPGKDQRDHAALHVHHRRTGKVKVTVTKAEINAELRQPAAAPDPVTEQRIHDSPNGTSIEHERGEFPALSRGTGRNCCRGIHEHHLEEEKGERGGVITGALQQKALPAEKAEEVAADGDAELMV